MIQIAHTSNIGYIYGGRVVSGLGTGMFNILSLMYIAETAPKDIRARLITSFQLCLVIGGLIAYFLTYGVSLHWPGENKQWRLVRDIFQTSNFFRPIRCQALGFQAVPAGLMLVGLLFTVESPRFLAGKYRDGEGLKNLAYLRKRHLSDASVCAEYAEILAQRDEEVENGAM
jgi:MFS family permease